MRRCVKGLFDQREEKAIPGQPQNRPARQPGVAVRGPGTRANTRIKNTAPPPGGLPAPADQFDCVEERALQRQRDPIGIGQRRPEAIRLKRSSRGQRRAESRSSSPGKVPFALYRRRSTSKLNCCRLSPLPNQLRSFELQNPGAGSRSPQAGGREPPVLLQDSRGNLPRCSSEPPQADHPLRVSRLQARFRCWCAASRPLLNWR